MVSYRDFEALLIIAVMGVLGIVNAMIFWTLNSRGILINEFISGTVTITDLMAVTIVFWLVVGVVIAAVKK